MNPPDTSPGTGDLIPEDSLPSLSGILRTLIDGGLGSAMGIGADVRARSGIARVARLSESELRRRLQDIYQSKYDSYLGYAINKLGNRQDAEDVVNESFARVLRANPDLDVPDALAGYVRTTVNNEANRRGSGNTRDRRERTGGDPEEIEETLRDTHKPFEDRVADEITIGLAISVLSPREQQVIALRHVEDRTEKDTAAMMNVQPGAVKRYRSDAVKKIQAALASTFEAKAG